MTVSAARPASTVVLLRPAGTGQEVFLVRRHDAVAFMGGAHVFPGGRVDPADGQADVHRLCDGHEAVSAGMPDIAAVEAVAHAVAAARELFEEAGVLLARTADGALLHISAQETERYLAYRHALAAHTITLADIASREHLRLALDLLVYFAHWVTPQVESRRFDTRFFMALAPATQEATHDQLETTHGTWLDPADALERCRRGEIALPPPTWTTLWMLTAHAAVATAIDSVRTRRVPRVEPGVIVRGDSRLVLLPGDPVYPAIPDFHAEETRFLLENGRWTPVSTQSERIEGET